MKDIVERIQKAGIQFQNGLITWDEYKAEVYEALSTEEVEVQT